MNIYISLYSAIIFLSNDVAYSLEDFSLALSDNKERSGILRINQPAPSNQQASALFKLRTGRE